MKSATKFSLTLSLILGCIAIWREEVLLGWIILAVCFFSGIGWMLFSPREKVTAKGISIYHPVLKMRSRLIKWPEISEVIDRPVLGKAGFVLCKEGVVTLKNGEKIIIDESTLGRIRKRRNKPNKSMDLT